VISFATGVNRLFLIRVERLRAGIVQALPCLNQGGAPSRALKLPYFALQPRRAGLVLPANNIGLCNR